MANKKALCPNCENSVLCPTWGEYKCKTLKRRIYGFTKLTECKHYKKRGKDFQEPRCQCEDCLENEELRGEVEE